MVQPFACLAWIDANKDLNTLVATPAEPANGAPEIALSKGDGAKSLRVTSPR